MLGEQLELALDWGRTPWQGRTPRSLSRGAGVVDNSAVDCQSGDANRLVLEPAQFTLFVSGVPEKES